MKTIFDINKVAYCTFWYENQNGIRSNKDRTSVHGISIDSLVYALPHPEYPCETVLERARRLNILDILDTYSEG